MAWFSKKKVAPSTPLNNLPRFNPFWAHTYQETRLPDPGTQNYAYTNLGLVEFTFIGAGVHNRNAIFALQPTPLYALQAVGISGLGGLQNGQVIFQPLINPDDEGIPTT